MDKLLILNNIKEHLKIRFDKDFADFLGIKTTTLAMWYKRNSYDVELLFNKCEFLNPEWLLTGKGSMLKSDEKSVLSQNITGNSNIQSGNDSNITSENVAQVKKLEFELQECKKLHKIKDIEIERQKKQIDKLFNMIN